MKNLIRDTDNHNAALKRKEEHEAKDRLKLLRKHRSFPLYSSSLPSRSPADDDGRDQDYDQDQFPEGKRKSNHEDKGEGDRKGVYFPKHRGYSRRSRAKEGYDEVEDDHDHRSRKRRCRHGSHESELHDSDDDSYYNEPTTRSQRHRSHRHHHRHHSRHSDDGNNDDDIDGEDANSKPIRPRSLSSSPKRSSRRERERKLGDERPSRRHLHQHRHRHSPRSNSKSRSGSPSYNEESNPRRSDPGRRKRQEREASSEGRDRRPLARTAYTSSGPVPETKSAQKSLCETDSDPLEELIGPLPKNGKLGSPVSVIQFKGRGAYRSGGHHDIDSHFAADYDPTIDVHLDEDADAGTGKGSSRRPVAGLMTEEDDWDMALEALRDRASWRQRGADRLRAAGFEDHVVEKWNQNPAFPGRTTVDRDDGNIDEVKWTKKGESREWDRGKVMDKDGHYDVKASW